MLKFLTSWTKVDPNIPVDFLSFVLHVGYTLYKTMLANGNVSQQTHLAIKLVAFITEIVIGGLGVSTMSLFLVQTAPQVHIAAIKTGDSWTPKLSATCQKAISEAWVHGSFWGKHLHVCGARCRLVHTCRHVLPTKNQGQRTCARRLPTQKRPIECKDVACR